MPRLTVADMKLIDSLFGMYRGHVVDFSNSRFGSFFRRDVGVDIYDDAYAIYGPSKGKRLRAFLELGQAPAIVRALHGLWEYREAARLDRGDAETVREARSRLSAIIEKLGGKPLPSEAAETEQTDPRPSKPNRPAESALLKLEAEFVTLQGMNDAAQARGYAFERFLKKWFDTWGLDARESFKLVGEQIDGSFLHQGSVYLTEARWRNSQADVSCLRAFQEKVGDRLEGSRGLFISYSGFSAEGLKAFTAKRVIMMDGLDIFYTLRRRLSLDDVIAAKFRIAVEERRPLVHTSDLFP